MPIYEPEKNFDSKDMVQSEEKKFALASPASDRLGIDSTTESELDTNADEALQLVGKERTAEFSEEFNRKLRRKLVGVMFVGYGMQQVV